MTLIKFFKCFKAFSNLYKHLKRFQRVEINSNHQRFLSEWTLFKKSWKLENRWSWTTTIFELTCFWKHGLRSVVNVSNAKVQNFKHVLQSTLFFPKKRFSNLLTTLDASTWTRTKNKANISQVSSKVHRTQKSCHDFSNISAAQISLAHTTCALFWQTLTTSFVIFFKSVFANKVRVILKVSTQKATNLSTNTVTILLRSVQQTSKIRQKCADQKFHFCRNVWAKTNALICFAKWFYHHFEF